MCIYIQAAEARERHARELAALREEMGLKLQEQQVRVYVYMLLGAWRKMWVTQQETDRPDLTDPRSTSLPNRNSHLGRRQQRRHDGGDGARGQPPAPAPAAAAVYDSLDGALQRVSGGSAECVEWLGGRKGAAGRSIG